MTNGDLIRAMSDEELAAMFTEIITDRDRIVSKKLWEARIAAYLVEDPAISKARLQELLQQEHDGTGQGTSSLFSE